MIPDFQSIMLPFLTIFSDGEEHTTIETNQRLAIHFNLTDEEIHKFVGALAGQGAKKGVFITTSRYTNEARDYQHR